MSGRPLVSPRVDGFARGVSDGAAFVLRFFVEAVRPPYHIRELIHQCYEVGVRSLPLITLTGLITGIVFTKQSRPSLAVFGATSWLPSLITIALVRSLAPLITALIVSGKVGSGIGAELGSMKVTEQIEAMEVSATNPFKYLVVTRTLATTLMVPALTVYCCTVGLIGSYLNIRGNESASAATFLRSGFETITFLDIGATAAREPMLHARLVIQVGVPTSNTYPARTAAPTAAYGCSSTCRRIWAPAELASSGQESRSASSRAEGPSEPRSGRVPGITTAPAGPRGTRRLRRRAP
jgi:phospholipid/cholesterol/gamma-HCH transport system permease protein